MNLFKLVGSIFINNQEANEEIDNTTSKAEQMANKIGSAMQTAGDKVTKVGKALAPVSAVVAGVMGASVKGASTFTDGMAKMSTMFDTTKVSVDDLGKKFLDLSNKSGLSASELAEAGYQALSAGIDVDNAVGFVETASNLARAGFTSASTAVDVLTTAINAYGLEQSDAEAISNKLIRTQNLGKTTVDELGSSMGKIIPTASAMHVNIDNLTAGYVGLTKQGIATAEATTYMNSMLNELGDSGTTVGGMLTEITGKSFQDLMAEGYSLADVLKILQDNAEQSGTNFNELWGSAEAGKAGLALLNGGVDEFNQTVGIMADNADDVGSALDKLETPSVKAKKSWNRLKNAGIELGTVILESLAPAMDKIAGVIENVTTWFSNLDDKHKKLIATIGGIIAVLSPVLIVVGKIIKFVGIAIPIITKVVAGIKAVIAVLGAIISPVGIVIAVIGALIGVFVTLYKKNEKFRNFVNSAWNKIKEVIGSVVDSIKEKFGLFVDFVKEKIEQVKGFFRNVKDTIVGIWESISTKVSEVWETIKNVIQVGIMLIGEILQTAWDIITLPWRFIWENVKEYVFGAWEWIKEKVTIAINAVSETIHNIWDAIVGFLAPILDGIKEKFETIWNGIKDTVTTVVTTIKDFVVEKWTAIRDKVKEIIDGIKTFITEKWNAIKTYLTEKLTAIKDTFTEKWTAVKDFVSEIFDKIRDKVSEKFDAVKRKVTEKLDAIKDKFSEKFDRAKEIVSDAIDNIKDFFNFDWSLPDIKLPHFSITGDFNLSPPEIPHFGVEWYSKAMNQPYMFTEPTIFSLNGSSGLKGAGEAGDEIMLGKNTMLNMIREAVEKETNEGMQKMTAVLNRILDVMTEWFPELANMQMILDTGVLVAETAEQMDEELGIIHRRKEW